MRAAVMRAGTFTVEDVEEPEPGPGQVLVASLANGICGSDLHMVEWMRQQAAASDSPAPAFILGHEFCVEVLDYGPGTEHRLPPGTRACSIPFVSAPGLPEPLVVGMNPRYPGALGERMVLDADRLLALPPEVPITHAALTEPLAVGVRAVAAAGRQQEGGPYVIVGCGPIGIAVMLALRAEGKGPIIAADLSAPRRQLAEELGADVVVDPTVDSPYERIGTLGFTELPLSPFLARGANVSGAVIFECVGAPGLLQSILMGAPRHSQIIVVGMCMGEDKLMPVLGSTKELTLEFINTYKPEEFDTSFRRIAEGQVDVEPLITSTVGLDATQWAFDRLAGAEEMKIVITPG